MIFHTNVCNGLDVPEDTSILIIHADDVGLSKSVNASTFQAMVYGSISSASLMVPCQEFESAVKQFGNADDLDLGIHITLTSDLSHHKWGPVSDLAKVPSLVDENGHFFSNPQQFAQSAKRDEVELEIRAQIARALDCGLKPTHLDSHQFVVEGHFGAFNTVLKLSQEYRIPCLLHRDILKNPLSKRLIKSNSIILDEVLMAYPGDEEGGLDQFYARTLSNLKPGIRILLIHPGYDDEEMQRITHGHDDYGAAWRQADYDFFVGEQCKALLKEQGIRLTNWAELSKLTSSLTH